MSVPEVAGAEHQLLWDASYIDTSATQTPGLYESHLNMLVCLVETQAKRKHNVV